MTPGKESSRVLVSLDRDVAGATARLMYQEMVRHRGIDPDDPMLDAWASELEALRAALATDRDELIERVAKALYMAPWTEMGGFPEVVWGRLGKHEREPHLLAARAVLAALETEGEQ